MSVSGKYIVNGRGDRLHLRGFNSFNTAQNCNLYFGGDIANGSHVLPNQRRYNRSFDYFKRMKDQWNVNTFRIMINEYCWLNREDIIYADRPAGQSGGPTSNPINHQQAITEVVQALFDNNMIAIITLGAARDTVQRVNGNPVYDFNVHPTKQYIIDPSMAMPNYRNSKDVWISLADTFKNYQNVIFDPYNEPHPYLCNAPSSFGTDCVSGCLDVNGRGFQYDLNKSMQCTIEGDNLDSFGNPQGNACSGNGGGSNGSTPPNFPINSCVIRPPPMSKARGGSGVLGIKTIVETIRSRGANNLIEVAGAVGAGDVRKWKQYVMPGGVSIDSLPNKLVVSVHRYSFNGSSSDVCPGGNNASCQTKLENESLKENGNGPLIGDSLPVIYSEFGYQFNAFNSSGVFVGDPNTDGALDGNGVPAGNCQNTLFVPFLINYAVSKEQGYTFHDPSALRAVHNGSHKPCSNFQAFRDYGENANYPDVVDDGNSRIEPTIYGKQFKANTASLSWTYGNQGTSDTTPNPFNFTSVNNVALGSTQVSNNVTIAGINAPAPISVSSGSSYQIDNNGPFLTMPSTIAIGQQVRVAHFAASTGLTTVTTTLTIGGVSGTFSSTTINADTTPDVFSFTTVSNADTNFAQASSLATITGINAATPISVSAGSSYSINNGPYVGTPGSIMNGDNVRVAHFTAATHSTTVTTTLTIGNVTGTFSSTTRAPGTDTFPDAFFFTPTTNVPINSTQVSNFTTITGINGNATISVSAGSSYEINLSGNFVTAPGTLTNNSKVRVAHFAAPTAGITITTTLNIGGRTGTFSSTTAAP